MCVGNIGAWAQGMTQVYLGGTPADSVATARVVTRGLAGIKDMFYYSTAKSLPDASWALFNVGVVIGCPRPQVNVWMAKLPPLTQQDDADRSTFVRAPVHVTAPQGRGIASGGDRVRLCGAGGGVSEFCTSRRGACVAIAGVVNDANPFFLRRRRLILGCRARPLASSRCRSAGAMWRIYQVKFYDAQGALVRLGDRGAGGGAAAR